ncbi:MAG TPA: hypothetical protein PLX35_05055, partial [Cyclobacteriaceae bacterium]|nr:hypothetical protein [Cyclobacteriaceae bacterium]
RWPSGSIKKFSTWWIMISFLNPTQISKALSAMTVDIWLSLVGICNPDPNQPVSSASYSQLLPWW